MTLSKDKNINGNVLKQYGVSDPKDIVKELDKYIIGQDEAKKTLAIAAFQRSIRSLQQEDILKSSNKLNKNNVLMLGPTGSGKTALIKALAKVLDCPITIFDISSTTTAGYVGTNVENALSRHIRDSIEKVKEAIILNKEMDNTKKCDITTLGVQYARYGILYLDEFDKCRSVADSGRDVKGEGVQQALLKILEGSIVPLHDKEDLIHGVPTFDTSDLLVICGGAFVDLSKIIQKRLFSKQIGFSGIIEDEKKKETLFEKTTTEDLMEFGFLPEILGRIPTTVSLNELSKEDLIQIMTNTKENLISQYVDLFEVFKVKLDFTPGALEAIADEALRRNTGARALKSIISKVMHAHQYDMFTTKPDSVLSITKKHVLNVLK